MAEASWVAVAVQTSWAVMWQFCRRSTAACAASKLHTSSGVTIRRSCSSVGSSNPSLYAHWPAWSPTRWKSAQCLIFLRMRVSLCLVNLVFRSWMRTTAGSFFVCRCRKCRYTYTWRRLSWYFCAASELGVYTSTVGSCMPTVRVSVISRRKMRPHMRRTRRKSEEAGGCWKAGARYIFVSRLVCQCPGSRDPRKGLGSPGCSSSTVGPFSSSAATRAVVSPGARFW
mmetsp:Transcript_1697/g.3421  ORF Transcript_1697/g.3421 Transcript_1697/m.3421 type:complete len:227 (-) Transcript_1697:106-786(-)